jgi:hypothetical protein
MKVLLDGYISGTWANIRNLATGLQGAQAQQNQGLGNHCESIVLILSPIPELVS